MPQRVSQSADVCYSEIFFSEKLSEEIASSAFQVPEKRSSPQKCSGNSWLQKGSRSPVIEHGEEKEIWDHHTRLTAEQLKFYSSPQGIVELNREGIEMALDRRVTLFFQQAILCYRMPFVFSARGADDQIGTASAVRLKADGAKETVLHKREAAHSSTIPALIARPKNGTLEQEFVYLKGGSSHAQHNATIGMHECINGADELLDGKGPDGRLRETAVKILNLVADGLDPVRATKKFIKKLEAQAGKSAELLGDSDARKAVLEEYQKWAGDIKKLANSDSSFFDRLIGVSIGAEETEEKILREVVYQRRYDIIRLQEVIESRIGKRIAEAQETMKKTSRAYFEYVLLKNFTEKSQSQILQKLLAKTPVIFEAEYEAQLPTKKEKTAFKAFQTRIKKLQKEHAFLLKELNRELRRDFRELSSAEFTYRAQVFKDLRKRVKNWTQREFCEQYEQKTTLKVSQSWVSRMEQPSRIKAELSYKTPLNQRCRYVTLEDAKRCASTFGVDPGLFLPCLFTSES